jgi:spore germination protein GerM
MPLKTKGQEMAKPGEAKYSLIKVYYPYGGRLNMEDRKVGESVSRMSVAEAVVEEFLKGPDNSLESGVPEDAGLLGIYPGTDGILYIDLSDEFRSNFQGDALSEFLLLRGLYESIVSNVQTSTAWRA